MTKTPETAYYDRQLACMPSCYAGPNAERYFGTIASWNNHHGLEGDTLARWAGLFRDPLRSGASALAWIGKERQLWRGYSETIAQYRARLSDAWTAWGFAGTPYSIVSQLALLNYTAEIVENKDWDWDGNTAAWARFWVVLTGHPFSVDAGWEWGDGSTWGGGQVWGNVGATAGQVRDIRRVIRQFKPAHTFCANIIVVLDAATWALEQPDGTWDVPANRSQAAVYWSG